MAETAIVDAFDEKAVDEHSAAVVAKAGSIDVSFNAIDIEGSTQGTALIELSPDEISIPVKKRLTTNFLTARSAARHMLQKKAGVILMITATPARMAFPMTGASESKERPSKVFADPSRANSHRRASRLGPAEPSLTRLNQPAATCRTARRDTDSSRAAPASRRQTIVRENHPRSFRIRISAGDPIPRSHTSSISHNKTEGNTPMKFMILLKADKSTEV